MKTSNQIFVEVTLPGCLSFQPSKAIDLSGVKHIKVGSSKWRQCINIAGADKTLVLKVEDPNAFSTLLEGMLALVEYRTGRPL